MPKHAIMTKDEVSSAYAHPIGGDSLALAQALRAVRPSMASGREMDVALSAWRDCVQVTGEHLRRTKDVHYNAFRYAANW